jgi:hypothetical protein
LRGFRSVTAVLGVAVFSVTVAAQAGAAQPSASGNAQAIAFYHSSQAAMARQSTVQFFESGYVSMDSTFGKEARFAWSWGSGQVPAGWVPASMIVSVGQQGGKMSWVAANLTSAGVHPHCTGGVCQGGAGGYPFQVVLDRTGIYGRFTPPSGSCYTTLHQGSPWAIGATWVGVSGAFAPMVRLGGVQMVTSTYGWTKYQTATETDTIAVRTGLWISSVVHVSAGKGPDQPAFTFKESGFRYQPNTEPVVELCSPAS